MNRILFFLAIFFTLPASMAHAIEINEEGAKTLQHSFQEMLDYQKTVNEGFGSVQVIYDKDVSIEQKSDHYVITLPNISLKSPETAEQEETISFNIGSLIINATPSDKEHFWNMTLSMSDKMTVIDNDGQEILSMAAQDQKTVALFNDQLGYFTKFNTVLSDITLSAAENETDAKLGGLQLYMNLDEDENGLFSGPGHILLSNFSIDPPHQDERVQVGELRVDYTMDQVKMPTLQEYKAKIEKHLNTLNALQESSEASTVSDEDVLNMLYDLYDFEINGFSFSYSGKNIEVIAKNETGESFKLRNGFLGMNFSGFKQEDGVMGMKFSYGGLTTPEDIKDIAPENANFELRASNIPYKTLTDVATNTIQAISQNPETAQMAGLGVMMRVPAILAQAETKLSFKDNGVSNNTYDVKLNGDIMTDMSSVTGFSAKFKSVFEGLDALLSVLETNAAEEESIDTFEYGELMSNLMSLKKVGTAGTGPNGKPAYSFILETTPQGQVLINGQDIQSVFSDDAGSQVAPASPQ